jgi:predicted nucleic acid-binding protein
MERIIADAGPLVAYLKRDDEHHGWAEEMFRGFRTPLQTCDAALSEAFFLLQQTHGGSQQLLALLERGIVVPDFVLATELPAIAHLLRRYESVPMSLADACLVRMAERERDSAVFTLDSDFKVYRRHGRQPIPLISPE